MSMFSVTFTGNLGSDAKLVTSGSVTYTRTSVATRHYNKQTRRDETVWMSVTSFDPKTAALARGGHLRKGTKVAVSGHLTIKPPEQKGGEWYFDVVGNDTEIMSRNNNGTPSPDADTQDDDDQTPPWADSDPF